MKLRLNINISLLNLDIDCRLFKSALWHRIILLRNENDHERHVSTQYIDEAIEVGEVKSIPRGNAVLRWR